MPAICNKHVDHEPMFYHISTEMGGKNTYILCLKAHLEKLTNLLLKVSYRMDNITVKTTQFIPL